MTRTPSGGRKLTSSDANPHASSKRNKLTSGPNATAMTYDGLGRLVRYQAGADTRFTYAGAALLSYRPASRYPPRDAASHRACSPATGCP